MPSRQTYEVGDHTVAISGKIFFGSCFRTEFNLARIKPVPDVAHIKDDQRTAWAGLPGLSVFILGLFCTSWLYSVSPALYFLVLGAGVIGMLAGFIPGLGEGVRFQEQRRGNPLRCLGTRKSAEGFRGIRRGFAVQNPGEPEPAGSMSTKLEVPHF